MTVYFVEIGDRIKIGFTDDLPNRLKAYPPHSILLATREGGRVTEAYEHTQWKVHRAETREWFYKAPELVEYIRNLDNPEPIESRVDHGEPAPFSEHAGTVARTLRERRGMSQSDLAFEVGCTRETIVRFERGQANITFSNLLSIVDALGYELQVKKR